MNQCLVHLLYYYKFLFSDQLWKFTNDSRLKNKGGIWEFSDTQWTLPSQGQEGVIEKKHSSKVLGIENLIPKSGSVVHLESLEAKKNDAQTWLIDERNDQDWFTITNPKSGLILTAKPDKSAQVKGKRTNILPDNFKSIICNNISTNHNTARQIHFRNAL